MSSEELEVLIRRVCDKDDYQAFESIFHFFYKHMCQKSFYYVKSKDLAEDVVSEVFTNLWKKRKKLTISTSLEAYLNISVRNKSIDYIRKAKNKEVTLEDIAVKSLVNEHTPESLYQYIELQGKIEKAIEELPDACKKVFLLNRFEGLKYREIAKELNISIKTVETQMGRALKFLRKNVLP